MLMSEGEGQGGTDADYVRTTISIPPHVLQAGKERASRFRLSFSDYLARLVEEEARSLREHLTIVAEPAQPYGSAAPAFKRQEAAPADARAALDKLTAAAKKSERARKQQAARKQRKPPRAA